MLPPGESQPLQSPPAVQRAVDLLLDLPADILDNLILGGLPARDVVHTSVLSPRWRRRWESVPGLDIELHDVGDDTAAWGSVARFLVRYAGPVGRVSIRDVPLRLCHRADHWLGLVADKKPRSLSVELPQEMVLWSLFQCDAAALAELELRCCAIPAPPSGFEGFQKLAKLDLEDVVFTGGRAWAQLEAMVLAAAPTLVELRLQNISFPVKLGVPGCWVIQAPNLRRLVLCLRITGAGLWELGPLPNLELARIFLNDFAHDRDYNKMFTAISNVSELHIGNFLINKQEAAMNIFQDLLWRFQNLRILRVDGDFRESPTKHLLSLSPFVESVEIKAWY